MNWHDITQCEGNWLKVAKNEDGTTKVPVEFLNPTRKKIHDISGDLRYRFDYKIFREGCYNVILEAALVFRKKTEQAKLQYRDELQQILKRMERLERVPKKCKKIPPLQSQQHSHCAQRRSEPLDKSSNLRTSRSPSYRNCFQDFQHIK